MKTKMMVGAWLLAGLLVARAQSGYVVTERGPDWKVLQKTEVVNGTNRVHRYVELATGMNFTNASGQWQESKEEITLLPTGGAAATQGRHKVYFPADIYNGVLEVVTPDGRHLKSRPLGVSYDDGSNTVFIATLKHAQGYLTSSNQVTYRDAFEGIKADLVATYRRSGFECDLVFRQQPPTPEQYGLDSDSSTLQMITEFFNTADPEQIPATSDDWYGLQDSTLKFGKLTMKQGKAFAIKTTNSAPQRPEARRQTPVYKRWLKLDNRKFLIEELPLEDLAEDLNSLPLTASSQKPVNSNLKFATNKHQFPLAHEFVSDTNQILLANVDLKNEPGVVLDYNEISTGQNDFTFQSGTTYYVSWSFYLTGNTTFEEGAVLKYDSNAEIDISADGSVVWNTSADHPAIFTSINDDSVGETISGSSGTPSLYDTINFLVPDGVLTVSNACFYYGQFGILAPADLEVWNCKFEHLNTGITFCNNGNLLSLHNVLFSDGVLYGDGAIVLQTGKLSAEHVTADNLLSGFIDASFSNTSVSLTNSLLTSSSLYYSTSGQNPTPEINNVIFLPNPTEPIYQPAASANYYLVTNSPYRNAGTTAIDPALLAELQTMTTYAPQDGGYPDTNAPDLGYHYPVNEDSDHDGLPDWWELKYFGGYTHTGADVDPGGITLLYDYQNGLDPNVIQFSIEVANNYVNSSNPTVHLAVTAGTPYFYTVLMDSTNFATTSWATYTSSNITINLGSNQGWHQLRVGLKGLPSDAVRSWEWKRLKLDTSPPQLIITSPSTSTVNSPTIQLVGYSPEALATYSYDLTNACGLVTNQQVLVLDQHFDSGIREFTTNTFQGFDISLTNGMNKIILHAADLAGNITTLATNFTLDYAGKTAPVINLTWPTNGTHVCGNSFTWDGFVSDSTVSVAVQVVSTNNNTNTVTGMVERNGRFWVDNVPLDTGTNMLTLTMTDAANNSTITNICVIQSALVLAMDPVSDPAQLWQPAVNLTGTISDASQAVWVNGVKGHNNGDGTWSASDVPTTSGGVASFTITAYAPDEQQPDGSYGN